MLTPPQINPLPTFEGFLTQRASEGMSDQEIIKAINANKAAYHETIVIPDNYHVFKPQGVAGRGLRNKLCYSNSLALAINDAAYDLAIGYVVAKAPNSVGYLETTPHAWNVEKATGRVFDGTLGKQSREHYVGRIVSPAEIVKLKDGSDVQDLLFEETQS